MPERVRVGVIGTSWLADLYHLPNLKSHPQADVVAICGRNEVRAREVAAKHEISSVFTDYREMFEKAQIDAVVIATPDDLHYTMTMDALDLGLHVLCEKPLAMSADQAREMYERAEAARVKHVVHFTWRAIPGYRYLKELIEDGYLGRIYHCDISYLGGYARSGQYRWRFDPSRSQGTLAGLGSHMIDLARLFVGEITRVSAHLAALVPTKGPDGSEMEPANQSAMLAVEFANGAQGTIQLSDVAHVAEGQEQHLRLYGEDGTLGTDGEGSLIQTEVHGARSTDQRFEALATPDRLWEDVVDRRDVFEAVRKLPLGGRLLIEAIVNDRPISPTFLDGLRAQEVIDAALASHERRVWEVVGSQASEHWRRPE